MPRPATELAAASPALRGVFCDIDDTLTLDGALVPEAYAQLVAARRAGLRVVPVTGRPAGWAAVIAATWPVDAVVAENGALAIERRAHDGRVATLCSYWDDAPARAAASERLAAIRGDVLAHVPRARLADDDWLRRCDLAFDIGETHTLAPDEVAAIVARIEAGGARAVTSTVHTHAFFGDYDKAKMLVRLGRQLWSEDLDGDARAHYLFVGDSPNDQPGFAHFPVCAGVANVTRYLDRLRPPPAYIATAPGGLGFAEIMSIVLANR